MKNIIIVLTVISCFISNSGSAETASGQFLKIGVGARASGMGEAYSAVSEGPSAIYWNPAGLIKSVIPEAEFTHTTWTLDQSYENLSIALPVSASSSAGIMVSYLMSGTIDSYDSAGDPAGTITAYDTAFTAAYAMKAGKTLSAGAAIKVVTSNIGTYSATAYAADLGVLFEPSDLLSLSFVAQNLGSKLKFITQEDSLPFNIKAGACFRNSGLLISTDFNFPSDIGFYFCVGAEYKYEISRNVSISPRAGFRSNVSMDGTLPGLSAGAGFDLGAFGLDYSILFNGDVGYNHRVSLRVRI